MKTQLAIGCLIDRAAQLMGYQDANDTRKHPRGAKSKHLNCLPDSVPATHYMPAVRAWEDKVRQCGVRDFGGCGTQFKEALSREETGASGSSSSSATAQGAVPASASKNSSRPQCTLNTLATQAFTGHAGTTIIKKQQVPTEVTSLSGLHSLLVSNEAPEPGQLLVYDLGGRTLAGHLPAATKHRFVLGERVVLRNGTLQMSDNKLLLTGTGCGLVGVAVTGHSFPGVVVCTDGASDVLVSDCTISATAALSQMACACARVVGGGGKVLVRDSCLEGAADALRATGRRSEAEVVRTQLRSQHSCAVAVSNHATVALQGCEVMGAASVGLHVKECRRLVAHDCTFQGCHKGVFLAEARGKAELRSCRLVGDDAATALEV